MEGVAGWGILPSRTVLHALNQRTPETRLEMEGFAGWGIPRWQQSVRRFANGARGKRSRFILVRTETEGN
jgi:hypothetical protein